jgi:hypothetical protein
MVRDDHLKEGVVEYIAVASGQGIFELGTRQAGYLYFAYLRQADRPCRADRNFVAPIVAPLVGSRLRE